MERRVEAIVALAVVVIVVVGCGCGCGRKRGPCVQTKLEADRNPDDSILFCEAAKPEQRRRTPAPPALS